jgi:nucleotide-binding universal stress UspA family protein
VYTKILVPLDGSSLSEQILPYARIFAETYGIPVELLRVNNPDIRPPFWPTLPGREYLQQVAARYLPPSVRIDAVEESGKPAEVIVDRAKGDPACLIAMATHGLSGARRWLLGSVASKVAHTTTNPLVFIRPAEGGEPAMRIELKLVVVPLDGSGLAEKVLPHVITLAKKMKLEVHLVRVYTLPADAYMVGGGVYMPAFEQQREAIKKEAETYLEGKVEELRAEGLDQVISTAIEGDPASEIIDLACKTPNNLVAMSSHGRSGIAQWMLGSVAEKVIHHSRDPVLVIRPTE